MKNEALKEVTTQTLPRFEWSEPYEQTEFEVEENVTAGILRIGEGTDRILYRLSIATSFDLVTLSGTKSGMGAEHYQLTIHSDFFEEEEDQREWISTKLKAITALMDLE
jgi:hypothetical protein